MPVSKISDAPANIRTLNDVDLTLAQVNKILEWYDAYKPAEDRGDIDSAMAIAIARFKREYTVEDGRWKKKATTDSLTVDLEMATLILEEKSEREKLREAREGRAGKYKIAAKEGGNLTPPKGYPSSEAEYGDPVNYKYPADADHARAALSYFNQEGQREDGGYSTAEWGVIGKRLARLIGRHLDADYEYKAGKLKAKETTAEASLDEQAQQIRRAFDEQFARPSVSPLDWLWVAEVFDDHVIVQAGEHLYSVPYSEQAGEIVFSGRDEWAEVERTYSPLSAMWNGIKSLYEQAQRVFSQPPARGQHPSAGRLYILMASGERQLLEDEDGLIWKDLLVPGDWYRPDGELVQVSKRDIDDVVDSFTNGALPPVPLPFGHVEHLFGDDPANNNGFVRRVRVGSADSPFEAPNGDYVLWGGLDVTEPETKEKIERGSIGNVSVWLEPDFHDLKDKDKVWPLVLWHVAFTDKPQITPELKNFVAFAATRDRGGMIMSEETQPPGNGPVAPTSEEPTALEAMQAKIDQLIEKVEKLENDNEALQAQAQKDAQVIGQQQDNLHTAEVENIVAALQGLGSHRMVKLSARQMVPPAVISRVRPVLMADRPNGDGRSALTLSVKAGEDEEEKQVSATQMVLDVINAIAEAGLLPDNKHRGQRAAVVPPAEPKTPEQEKADKDKAVEEYVKAHPEVVTGRR